MNGSNINEGYDLWIKQHKEWTEGHIPYDPNGSASSDYKKHPVVRNIPKYQLPNIYNNLTSHSCKKFVRPVPLSFIFAIYSNSWNNEKGSWELSDDSKWEVRYIRIHFHLEKITSSVTISQLVPKMRISRLEVIVLEKDEDYVISKLKTPIYSLYEMKFIYSLYIIFNAYSIYANVYAREEVEKEDCDNQINEYEDCIYMADTIDYEDHCAIIASDKCKNFYDNLSTVVPSCQENFDIMYICTTDNNEEFCSFHSVFFDNDDETDLADDEIISTTCKSEKCTNAYLSFLDSVENIEKIVMDDYDTNEETKSKEAKFNEARNKLKSNECTAQQNNDLKDKNLVYCNEGEEDGCYFYINDNKDGLIYCENDKKCQEFSLNRGCYIDAVNQRFIYCNKKKDCYYILRKDGIFVDPNGKEDVECNSKNSQIITMKNDYYFINTYYTFIYCDNNNKCEEIRCSDGVDYNYLVNAIDKTLYYCSSGNVVRINVKTGYYFGYVDSRQNKKLIDCENYTNQCQSISSPNDGYYFTFDDDIINCENSSCYKVYIDENEYKIDKGNNDLYYCVEKKCQKIEKKVGYYFSGYNIVYCDENKFCENIKKEKGIYYMNNGEEEDLIYCKMDFYNNKKCCYISRITGYYISSLNNNLIYCDNNKYCKEVSSNKGYYILGVEYDKTENNIIYCDENNDCKETYLDSGYYFNPRNNRTINCTSKKCYEVPSQEEEIPSQEKEQFSEESGIHIDSIDHRLIFCENNYCYRIDHEEGYYWGYNKRVIYCDNTECKKIYGVRGFYINNMDKGLIYCHESNSCITIDPISNIYYFSASNNKLIYCNKNHLCHLIRNPADGYYVANVRSVSNDDRVSKCKINICTLYDDFWLLYEPISEYKNIHTYIFKTVDYDENFIYYDNINDKSYILTNNDYDIYNKRAYYIHLKNIKPNTFPDIKKGDGNLLLKVDDNSIYRVDTGSNEKCFYTTNIIDIDNDKFYNIIFSNYKCFTCPGGNESCQYRTDLIYLIKRIDRKKDNIVNEKKKYNFNNFDVDLYDKYDKISLILFIIFILITIIFFFVGAFSLKKYGLPNNDSFYIQYFEKFRDDLNREPIIYTNETEPKPTTISNNDQEITNNKFLNILNRNTNITDFNRMDTSKNNNLFILDLDDESLFDKFTENNNTKNKYSEYNNINAKDRRKNHITIENSRKMNKNKRLFGIPFFNSDDDDADGDDNNEEMEVEEEMDEDDELSIFLNSLLGSDNNKLIRIALSKVVLENSLLAVKKHPLILGLNSITTVCGIVINLIIVTSVYGIVVKYDHMENVTKVDGFNIFEALILAFLLFSYYFLNEIINNIIYVTISGTVTFHLERSVLRSPIIKSFKRSLIQRFGSICLGSLLNTFVRRTESFMNSEKKERMDEKFNKILDFCFGNDENENDENETPKRGCCCCCSCRIICKYIWYIFVLYTCFVIVLFAFIDDKRVDRLLILIFLYIPIGVINITVYLLEFLILLFNDYTFSVIGIYWKTYVKSSKVTFHIMEDYGFDALCNDTIIRCILIVSKYVIILLSLLISNIVIKLLNVNEQTKFVYLTGLFFICRKIFSSITSGIHTTSYQDESDIENRFENEALDGKKLQNLFSKENESEFIVSMIDKFVDTQDDILSHFNAYYTKVKNSFLFGNK
ncbi:hypothetical protein BCR32DRAFT_293066 [Anaeromyces robustus]|uniref:Protein PNS1 n=1 Tax=Anaeromyces robustus TaxID=1754192 RepID=A0A1Y1X7N7_9FUNG|nr:hypothetical protein BCR32DRAFT_293066 [Anaeromyces robustus]|eukprot:ORX81771.1 hypothetical protein BCR32DRAFT_293066 [Anaeromyces robustus]